MHEETPFLEGIKADPENLFSRLVYADWLEDRGDARSEYLRVDGQLHELIRSLPPNELAAEPKYRQLRAQLKKLARTLDAEWVAVFDALRPKFFRCRACHKVISAKEAIDTNPYNYRKMKTSRYCKPCYEDAVRSRLHRGTSSFGGGRSAERDYHGEASDEE